ncbi:MAG: glycerol-3-phosphate 1-O-acyltransferase PlsY [Rhodomicrobium sp.]
MALNGNDLWLAAAPGRPWLVLACAFLLGYALGSIPFGWIYSHLGGAGDIRKVGSGNIGATNVLRTGRKGLALATLLSDAAKAFVPVLLCRLYLGFEPALFAAAGAFLGHLFPVWLKFRGGKGVATYIGVVTALYWPAGAFFCAAWLCVALLFRYSSLSALAAAALTPAFVLAFDSPALAGFLFGLSALLIARHHQNIRNLITGEESKIKLSKANG